MIIVHGLVWYGMIWYGIVWYGMIKILRDGIYFELDIQFSILTTRVTFDWITHPKRLPHLIFQQNIQSTRVFLF